MFGPPPRVRGQCLIHGGFAESERSTPARAGTIGTRGLHTRACTVHPRACGDNEKQFRSCGPLSGPPPRVRGQYMIIQLSG